MKFLRSYIDTLGILESIRADTFSGFKGKTLKKLSGVTSPLYKQQVNSDRDRQRAKALKKLLEANARWNEERRDAAKIDIRKVVDETGQSNLELRKEMIYSWEK